MEAKRGKLSSAGQAPTVPKETPLPTPESKFKKFANSLRS
jgi:hypothetical protein